MASLIDRRFIRILPLLAATLAVAIGTYFVGISAIDNLQTAQAEYEARSFSKYLVNEVEELPAIIDGTVTTGPSLYALSMIRPIGSVYKFRVYDRSGKLKIDSSPFAAGHIVSAQNAFEDGGALAVAMRGQSSFAMYEGDGKTLPRYYSEAMVPLTTGPTTIGVVSVLSDQTEAWPELFAQFRAVIGQILLLIGIAFCVPISLYVRKLVQFERTRRRLRHSFQHDALTGLVNRAGFVRLLNEELSNDRKSAGVGVLIVDLDRFKDINEANGQSVGDELLRRVGERVSGLLGEGQRVARLGADEFAIVQRLSTPGDLEQLGNTIARTLAYPFVVDSRTLQAGASIGYARFPEDGTSAEELMRAADVALRHAKAHARGRAVAFDPAMEAERRGRINIDRRLRAALAGNEFSLHYQPVYELRTGTLRGFEALVRLNDESGRPISPAQFIPVAEEIGLIGEIGGWVLNEACRTAVLWPDELFVAVNLSPAQFADGKIAEEVSDALRGSGLKPTRLELEVTESLLIGDSDRVLQQLLALKALGPSLALDDFGTGYSSLSYLWRFPFDKLKVDRSFMSDLSEQRSKSREILATILALGRVLNLQITAEGVETEAQAMVLRDLQCDLGQGYLFGRPQPVVDVAATILKGAIPAAPAPKAVSRSRRAAQS
jgi:diguanylate cyclase (GGDEF)-like protein